MQIQNLQASAACWALLSKLFTYKQNQNPINKTIIILICFKGAMIIQLPKTTSFGSTAVIQVQADMLEFFSLPLFSECLHT
jgi:hypothetical protein